jgi:N-formylmaleamate deformylase
MKAFQEGFVPANGIQIHFYRSQPQNNVGRSILFLHSATENGLCWSRLAQALPDLYDLVLVDGRGHGRSDGPVSGYSADDRAGDVAGVIQALGLDQPVLVGHAMGAETAIATASIYPELVRAVVLEDPPWPGRFFGSTPEERAERASDWREDILMIRARSREELLAQARESNPTWAEEELGPWADAKKEANPNLVGMVTAPRRRWSDYVRQAVCPILLITGDPERGAIVSQRTIDEVEILWKNGRCANIPGAGHSIRRDQFVPYLAALQGFLAEVTA